MSAEGRSYRGLLLRMLLRGLSATWRFRESVPPDCVALLDGRSRCVVAFWHGKMLPVWYRFGWSGAGALVSMSRDGELLAEYLEKGLGYAKVIRGSSSRGGSEALRAAVDLLGERSCLITPDGPRGPARKAKPGALIAALRAGAPVLCVGWSARRVHRLGSWDSMEIPYPFARIEIRYCKFSVQDKGSSESAANAGIAARDAAGAAGSGREASTEDGSRASWRDEDDAADSHGSGEKSSAEAGSRASRKEADAKVGSHGSRKESSAEAGSEAFQKGDTELDSRTSRKEASAEADSRMFGEEMNLEADSRKESSTGAGSETFRKGDGTEADSRFPEKAANVEVDSQTSRKEMNPEADSRKESSIEAGSETFRKGDGTEAGSPDSVNDAAADSHIPGNAASLEANSFGSLKGEDAVTDSRNDASTEADSRVPGNAANVRLDSQSFRKEVNAETDSWKELSAGADSPDSRNNEGVEAGSPGSQDQPEAGERSGEKGRAWIDEQTLDRFALLLDMLGTA